MSTIPLKSETDIYNEILASLKTDSVKGLATYPNSAADNVFIQPLKVQTYETYILIDFADKIGNLADLRLIANSISYQNTLRYVLNLTLTQTQELISIAIDNLAANWNKTRNPARVSRGYVRIYLSAGDALTLPEGISVSTLDGIYYVTKNSFTNFLPEYSASEGNYFIDIFIEAVEAGENGNVEAGAIISLNSVIPNAVSCVNLQRTQFGRDEETDNEFIDRIQSSWVSRRTSLFQGLIDMLAEYPGIVDSSIVTHNSEFQVRNDKNAVDIYLIAEERNQLKEDIFHGDMAAYAWERINDEINFNVYPIIPVAGYSYYKLLSQPVLEVSSVSWGATPTGPWTVFSPASYSLVPDFSSAYEQSVRGHDYLQVNTEGLVSPYYIKIEYVYNRIYKDLQTLILNYENLSIGSDILFKKGKQLDVDIAVKLSLFSGYSIGEVQAAVTSNLTKYFAGGTDDNDIYWPAFKLGQTVDESDILDRIIETEGVDYIDVDTFEVTINGETGWSRYNTNFANYLRLGVITFI